jgi:hypothetical protein
MYVDTLAFYLLTRTPPPVPCSGAGREQIVDVCVMTFFPGFDQGARFGVVFQVLHPGKGCLPQIKCRCDNRGARQYRCVPNGRAHERIGSDNREHLCTSVAKTAGVVNTNL